MKVFLRLAILTIVYMIAPLSLSLLAGILAPILGCENLNEGFAPECPAGETLYTMFVAGWYMFFTIPTGLVALKILVIAFLIYLFRKKRHQR